MISRYEDINGTHLDVLKEIGSIGTGYAATALSEFLDEEIKMTVPEVSVLEFNRALEQVGDPEEMVSAVLVEMSGELEGIMLFIFRMDFMNTIFSRVLGIETTDYSEITPMMISAMEEIGNIMISSYINALSRLTGMSIRLSVPSVTADMLGAILTVPMAQQGIYSDKLMFINGNFILQNHKVNSEMMMLPDVHSLNVLMERLGVHTENG